jgi:acyl-CoA thioester hydrolase
MAVGTTAPTPQGGAAHQMDLNVRFYELDPYGHVNHSVYVQYFESGRIEALRDANVGLDRLQQELDVNLVVVQISVRFLRPAFLADRLIVESGITSVGRAKATWAQRVRRGDEVLASQVMVSGCTNSEGRPRRFPAELIEALKPIGVAEDWLGSAAPK